MGGKATIYTMGKDALHASNRAYRRGQRGIRGDMMIQVRRLSEHEERILKEIVRGPHKSGSIALRAQVILLSSQRWSVPRIAKYLGLHDHSVRSRIRRFNSQGLDALEDMPRSGRPRVYGEEQREEVVQLAQTNPADLGLPLRAWTLSALQRHLVESGVAPAIGRETIRRILIAGDHWQTRVDLSQ